MSKVPRHRAILQLIREEEIPSQEVLGERLREHGFDVAQATLSRDIRELGLVKSRTPEDSLAYASPSATTEPSPALARLLPALFAGVDGTGNLLVVKTLAGGAQPVAAALDAEAWPEVLGTVAGDDTILLILRDARRMGEVTRRISELAGV